MKKSLVMALCIALCAALATGGTLAYLQEQQADVNVMTLGSVHIKQHEYERALNADGTYKTDTEYGYVLKDFTQAKPLFPATEVDANGQPYNFGAGDYEKTLVKMSQVDSQGSMNVFVSKNAQDKFVTVENTGKSDAYVRTVIAFELGNLAEDKFDSVISSSAFMIDQDVWKVTDVGVVAIDDNKYVVEEYIYNGGKALGGVHENGILPAGDTTYPSLAQVYMTATATNEDVEALDGNKNGTYDILVLSQAVQTAGFADAKTALDTAFGKVDEKNINTWFADKENGASIPVLVADDDALIENLENGKDVVLIDDVKIEPATMSNAYGTTGIRVYNGQTIDGGNNVLDIKGAGGTWDSGICTSGGEIKNITVTGSFRGVFIKNDANHNERVVLDNVIINGTTYTISCDEGSGNGLEAYNSTFNGWTSYAGTLGDATFTDCSFGYGNGYAFLRPYAPTEFINCTFTSGGGKTYKIDPLAAVTFKNCTFDGVALTADNLKDLVTSSNIANATVIK